MANRILSACFVWNEVIYRKEIMEVPYQINYSAKLDAEGNLLERSTLINIRSSTLSEAVTTFQQLKQSLNGDLGVKKISKTTWVAPKANQSLDNCPRCNGRLIIREAKKPGPNYGKKFYGCMNWTKKGCSFVQEV